MAFVTVLHGSYNAASILYPVLLERLSGAAGADVLAVGAAAAWVVGLVLIASTRGDLGYSSPGGIDSRSRTRQ